MRRAYLITYSNVNTALYDREKFAIVSFFSLHKRIYGYSMDMLP